MPVLFSALLAGLVFGLYCYQTALDGPFVLDDTPNFYGLGFVHNISSALAYSYNGPAGTRWLSYLSFTLPFEVAAWKLADAFPFKLINLIIHGINATLVFAVLRALLKLHYKNPPYLALYAFALSAAWALHPAHVSTVLYSVQRMTLLTTSAVLLGLLFHMAFIARQQQSATTKAWLFYTFCIWFITAAGILCKESAVLLPLYIMVCLTLTPRRVFSRFQYAFTLILPYLMLLAYLLYKQQLGFGGRDFSMSERLLSQIIIVKEYLFKIASPSFNSFSLYYDDFIVARHIGDKRVLVSAAFWLALLGTAWLKRNSIPGLWFGCLWFLAGHSLESGIIPLELYFDHRNYLPSLGVLLMMAALLTQGFMASHKKSIRLLLVVMVLAIYGKNLYSLQNETSYWRSDAALAASLVAKHPESLRATQFYIETLNAQGRYKESIRMIEYIYAKFGVHASTAIFQVGFSCLSQPDITINHQALLEDLKTLPEDSAVSNAMEFLLELARDNACPSVNWDMFERYTDTLLSNPKQRRHYHNLVFLLVSSHMHRGDQKAALESSFKLANNLVTPKFALLQLHLSISSKNLASAEAIYANIERFDKVTKTLYRDDIYLASKALEQLRHETKD